MYRQRWVARAVAFALVVAPAAALAQGPKTNVDPEAVAALERMGAYLRSLQAAKITSQMTTDQVLDSGQKVQMSGVATMEIRRPDRLRADIMSDRKNEQLFYDGKTFTVYQPSVGYYASFSAPPTLDGLVDVAEQRGLELPLADLFRWGTDKSHVGDIRSASRIGVSTVQGVRCDHYAFRQSDVDWEVCIEQGSHPLPRKIVVTTTTERSQPQHVSILSWDLSPRLDESLFQFVPPSTAHQIDFAMPGRKQP